MSFSKQVIGNDFEISIFEIICAETMQTILQSYPCENETDEERKVVGTPTQTSFDMATSLSFK